MVKKRIPLIALSTLVMGLTVATVFVGKTKTVVTHAYTNGDGATYYNGISSTATGTTLLTQLQSLNTTKLQSRVGYNSMPSKFTQTDPGNSSGKVMSFYSGNSASYSGNMNREHVWPASRTVGGRNNDPLEDDIHMVRPTLKSENSSRGNSLFTFANEAGWDPGTFGVKSYRGDSARIIFYCVVADDRLSLVDKDTDYTSNHTMGKLSDLLYWNLQYPVADRERTRNEAAESLQGNRNPFIDHPEYACKIWGNTNSTTQSICSGATHILSSVSATTLPNKTMYDVGDYFDPTGLVIYRSYFDETGNGYYTYADHESEFSFSPSLTTPLTASDSQVTVTYGGLSFKLTINVIKLTGITLSKTSLSLKKGNTFQLYVYPVPAIANVPDLIWASTNTSVATVDQTGKVTAVGSGTCKINVITADGMYMESCNVTVSGGKNGCGGNIVTTSVILSAISFLGVTLLVIKKTIRKRKDE